MAAKSLTEKQKRFIDFYIQSGNQTDAARKAGYKKPHVQGAQNLEKLRNQINERLSELESARVADAKEVMEYLTSVMRREHKENIVVTTSEESSMYVPDDKGTMRKQTIKREIPQLVEIPAKLCDANKAAELLAKRYGLLTDNFHITGDVGVTIVDDIPNGSG